MFSGISPASTCSAHAGDVRTAPSLNALACIKSSLVSTDFAAEPYADSHDLSLTLLNLHIYIYIYIYILVVGRYRR